jgi:hypothetical protein
MRSVRITQHQALPHRVPASVALDVAGMGDKMAGTAEGHSETTPQMQMDTARGRLLALSAVARSGALVSQVQAVLST